MRIIVTSNVKNIDKLACEIIEENFNLQYMSIEQICANYVFKKLKDKYNYKTLIGCLKEYEEKEEEWVSLINDFNKNKHTISDKVYLDYQIYCGIFDLEELEYLKNNCNIDYIIWIKDNTKKFNTVKNYQTIKEIDCDFTISYNNEKNFEQSVITIITNLFNEINNNY